MSVSVERSLRWLRDMMLNKVPVIIPPEVYRCLEEYVRTHEPWVPAFGPSPSLGQVLAAAHRAWFDHVLAAGPPREEDLEPIPIPEWTYDE